MTAAAPRFWLAPLPGGPQAQSLGAVWKGTVCVHFGYFSLFYANKCFLLRNLCIRTFN